MLLFFQQLLLCVQHLFLSLKVRSSHILLSVRHTIYSVFMCLSLNLKIALHIFFVLKVMADGDKKDWNMCHGPVGSVCGFDHSPYNEVVEDVWYEQLYPLLLSRYNHQVLGNVVETLVIDLASKPPMDPSSPEAAAPQECCATLHPIAARSLLPSVAVSIWVEYSFNANGIRLSPLSQRKGSHHNNMVFEAGYGRQLIRYLKSPIQPGEGRAVKIKTCLLVEETPDGNDNAARIEIMVSETN